MSSQSRKGRIEEYGAIYKALAEEKFKWPKPADELLALSGEQINWLLDGYDISLFKGHKKLQYDSLG